MTLTAADVHAVTFATVRFGQRGYDLEEVDKFLETVQHDLATLHEQVELANTKSPSTAGSSTGASSSDASDERLRQMAARLMQSENALTVARADADALRRKMAQAEEAPDIGKHSADAVWPGAAEQISDLEAALAEARQEATMARVYAERVRAEAEHAVARARMDARRVRDEAEQMRSHMLRDSVTLERLLNDWQVFASEQHRQLGEYLGAQLKIVRDRNTAVRLEEDGAESAASDAGAPASGAPDEAVSAADTAVPVGLDD